MKLYSNIIIEQIANLNPNQVVLQSEKGNFLAGNLLDESKQLAAALWDAGMRADDKIVIASEPGIDFVKIMFATMMLQTKVAIIDPEMGRENYSNKLDQFKPAWVFLDARILLLQKSSLLRVLYFRWKKNGLYFPVNRKIKTILTGPKIPFLNRDINFHQLAAQENRKVELIENLKDRPYLITYTSGTTAEPKGVLHGVHGLSNSIGQVVDLIKSNHAQILATHLPHFMLIGACAGIGVRLWKGDSSAKERIEFINKFKITTLFGPPAEYLLLMQYCADNNNSIPESISHVMLGSAPVHKSFLERLIKYLPLHTKITCIYGMTENLVVCTMDGRKKVNYPAEGDPLGTPVEGINLRIADDGEIMLFSNQLFLRYDHLQDKPKWHATGDLGHFDKNGILILTGRKKEMIIRRNFNLYPALYESTIKKIPGIGEAVLVGKYNEELADEEVFLVIESDGKLNKEKVRRQLERGEFSIDKEAWPDHILFRGIPRKGRQQKLDRVGLVETL